MKKIENPIPVVNARINTEPKLLPSSANESYEHSTSTVIWSFLIQALVKKISLSKGSNQVVVF
jgi:hypothetical protein